MLTYLLSDTEGRSWVVRHPPGGQRSGGAHDTDREARVMTALADTPVPVPAVRAVGTDRDPLGRPCHVTDYVPGCVPGDADTAIRHLSPETLNTASRDTIAVLAALHSVDPDIVGLGDLGPRTDYVARQLHRWRKVVGQAASPDLAEPAADLRALADLLDAYRPADPAPRIVHGDYRLGNTIVGDDGRIRAVLDWELASLGDPLADLALLAEFWNPPPEAMLGVRMPTSAAGAIDLDAALAQYADATGVDLDGFWYYRALSCWRLACSAFRARARYASGAMGDGEDLTKFVTACATWTALARESIPAGRSAR
jgi:aminoglycoside phosphotransferase (APT) family kinase protein